MEYIIVIALYIVYIFLIRRWVNATIKKEEAVLRKKTACVVENGTVRHTWTEDHMGRYVCLRCGYYAGNNN